MLVDFNCSLLAAGMNHARLVHGSIINTTNDSVICVKCEVILDFLGFHFSASEAIAEVWSLDQENAKCFKVAGEINLTAAVLNESSLNDDIKIAFYVRVNPNEGNYVYGMGRSVSLSLSLSLSLTLLHDIGYLMPSYCVSFLQMPALISKIAHSSAIA